LYAFRGGLGELPGSERLVNPGERRGDAEKPTNKEAPARIVVTATGGYKKRNGKCPIVQTRDLRGKQQQ